MNLKDAVLLIDYDDFKIYTKPNAYVVVDEDGLISELELIDKLSKYENFKDPEEYEDLTVQELINMHPEADYTAEYICDDDCVYYWFKLVDSNQILQIGKHKTTAREFAFDGCHKFYLIESEDEKQDMYQSNWNDNDFFPIRKLPEMFRDCGCSLRFINRGPLHEFATIVAQFQNKVTFKWLPKEAK